MQDRVEPSQPVFTVKDCGMAEFNGKYYVDTAQGIRRGKRCYRKDVLANAGSECTVEWYDIGLGSWYMTKNHGGDGYYYVRSGADQPPTSDWRVTPNGSGSPPELVYEGSDVPNFYLLFV